MFRFDFFLDLFDEKISPEKVAVMGDALFGEKVFCLCETCVVAGKTDSGHFHSILHSVLPVTFSEGRYISVQKLNKAGI
jgi:hypothetical protein